MAFDPAVTVASSIDVDERATGGSFGALVRTVLQVGFREMFDIMPRAITESVPEAL